jgi:hypothetical protein
MTFPRRRFLQLVAGVTALMSASAIDVCILRFLYKT